MKILFVSAEVAPFAKTGELADVAHSLPMYLAKLGHDVRVVMPKYKNINLTGKVESVKDFCIPMPLKKETCILKKGSISRGNKNIPIYFIENYQYFDRDFLYAYDDDCERFAFFSRAVLKMLKYIDFKPDIIHLNDWHTAAISMILNEKYREQSLYREIATLYTIHDLNFQGICSKGFLNLLGVNESVFDIEKTEFYNMINYSKMGIVYSDLVNTISEEYSNEIQTHDHGNGLDGVLRTRKRELHGIINGIDYIKFNPKTDKYIKKNYGYNSIREKVYNKYYLQNKLGLPKKDVPVIAFISPLTEQKGVELLLNKIDEICKNDVQLVILGIGNAVYEYSLKFAMSKYPYQISLTVGHDDGLLTQIFAGSDIYIMPSKNEPCGVNQLIALRYGTIPVVRKTGGLVDSVIDIEEDKENGYGYIFEKFSSIEMMKAIQKAIDCCNKNPELWEKMIKRALELDFSWESCAKKYEKIYQLAIKNRKTLLGEVKE